MRGTVSPMRPNALCHRPNRVPAWPRDHWAPRPCLILRSAPQAAAGTTRRCGAAVAAGETVSPARAPGPRFSLCLPSRGGRPGAIRHGAAKAPHRPLSFPIRLKSAALRLCALAPSRGIKGLSGQNRPEPFQNTCRPGVHVGWMKGSVGVRGPSFHFRRQFRSRPGCPVSLPGAGPRPDAPPCRPRPGNCPRDIRHRRPPAWAWGWP